MTITTGYDIVVKAMQKAGILTKGEVPDADETNDVLDALNAMLGSWSTESIMCFAHAWETFNMVPGQQLYQMGPTAADFVTTRPMLITEGYVRQAGSQVDYPLEVINDSDWNDAIYVKNIQGIPEYINNDNAYPNVNLRFWPVPSAAYTVFLLSEKELTEFTSLTQQINLPPGWSRALISNLAVEIAPDFGVPVPDATAEIAGKSKGAIALQIMKTRDMDCIPQTTSRRRNIYADRTN